MPGKLKAPEICPVCGEEVPPQALACPECGADHNSGWKEDAGDYDAAALPDDDFDYNAFVREEFGVTPKPAGMKWGWWITAILMLLAMALFFFYGR